MKGLYVRLVARQGQEGMIDALLRDSLPLAREEQGTLAWFALRKAHGEYAVLDVFPDQSARDAHLQGPIAASLIQRADELFAGPPHIHQFDVLAANLPSGDTPADGALFLTFKSGEGKSVAAAAFLRASRAGLALHLEALPDDHGGEFGLFEVHADGDADVASLLERVPHDLLGTTPDLDRFEVIAAKLP